MDKETLLIYDDLFNTYKKNDILYMEKCKHYKKEISNTNTFEFKDFIPYPDNSQLDFNNWIFNKKEFQTEIQENDTCDSRIFRLSANQKFIKNFLSPFTPYNGILLFHSVGVGKTCTAISIVTILLTQYIYLCIHSLGTSVTLQDHPIYPYTYIHKMQDAR